MRTQQHAKKNAQLDAIVCEIQRARGTVDRIDRRKHVIVYWTTFEGDKRIQVCPSSSRSTSGVRNCISEIRREARRCSATTRSSSSTSVMARA